MSFFDDGCGQTTTWTYFGIVDDNDKPQDPAYITDTDPDIWGGIVSNKLSIELKYYSIDNCRIFYQNNQRKQKESTCDAALLNEDNVRFIEIKNRMSKGWLTKGVDQLLNTIKLYKSIDANASKTRITGHVCNAQRPRANAGNAGMQAKFKKASGGYKLFVQHIIEVD